jgi:tetratricopeptide (TPR) repeat protein
MTAARFNYVFVAVLLVVLDHYATGWAQEPNRPANSKVDPKLNPLEILSKARDLGKRARMAHKEWGKQEEATRFGTASVAHYDACLDSLSTRTHDSAKALNECAAVHVLLANQALGMTGTETPVRFIDSDRIRVATPAGRASALRHYEAAVNRYQKAVEICQARFAEFSEEEAQEPTPELVAWLIPYQFAVIDGAHARAAIGFFYSLGSADRKKKFRETVAHYEASSELLSETPGGARLKLNAARFEIAVGDIKAAANRLEPLWRQPDAQSGGPGPLSNRLRADALCDLIRCWCHPTLRRYDDAIREGEAWLERDRIGLGSEVVIKVRLATAYAYECRAGSRSKVDERRGDWTQALKLIRECIQPNASIATEFDDPQVTLARLWVALDQPIPQERSELISLAFAMRELVGNTSRTTDAGNMTEAENAIYPPSFDRDVIRQKAISVLRECLARGEREKGGARRYHKMRVDFARMLFHADEFAECASECEKVLQEAMDSFDAVFFSRMGIAAKWETYRRSANEAKQGVSYEDYLHYVFRLCDLMPARIAIDQLDAEIWHEFLIIYSQGFRATVSLGDIKRFKRYLNILKTSIRDNRHRLEVRELFLHLRRYADRTQEVNKTRRARLEEVVRLIDQQIVSIPAPPEPPAEIEARAQSAN